MGEEIYICPRGCKPKKPITSLRGWKTHMSVMHNGFSAEEVATATGSGGEGVRLIGQPDFDTYAARMPEDASGLGAQAETMDTASNVNMSETEPIESTTPVIVTPKRIKAKMNKLKKRLSTDLPNTFFTKRGMPLDSEDKDMLSEAFDMVFDVLDIGFAIEPYSVTIKNRIFVFLYPVLVMAGLFVIKTVENAESNNRSDSSKG